MTLARVLALAVLVSISTSANLAYAATPSNQVLNTDGVWSIVPNVYPVAHHTAAFDPVGGQTIVFGGYGYGNRYTNQTLSISLAPSLPISVLDAIDSAYPIAPRANSTMVYDSRRRRGRN